MIFRTILTMFVFAFPFAGPGARPVAAQSVMALAVPSTNESDAGGGPIGVTLQLRTDVQLQSHVVRVGDVVRPVGTKPTGWEDLAEKALGLIPPGGQLRMERQRISECLERSKLLHQSVRWSGPPTVAIKYLAIDNPTIQNPIQTVAYQHSTNLHPSDSVPTFNNIVTSRPLRSVAGKGAQRLLPAERNRVERMIMTAIKTTHPEVLESYEAGIPIDDQGIHGFDDLQAVRGLRFLEPPAEGTVTIEIVGEAELSELTGTCKIELQKLPVIAYTTTALNRGDMLSIRDVVMKPIERQRYDQRQVQDLQLILNKEMTRSISANQPIVIGDLSEPIVIKRNDRVELRVIGAGITVVTEGRALAPAAAGESVMVETESPKQKIAARAVRSGLVEIITRPPQTK